MNDDKNCKDTCTENNLSSNGGNKGVTSSVGGGSDSHLHHPFSSMGPNHNHHQYHGHHHHQQESLAKIGTGSGSTINSNNCHFNGGGGDGVNNNKNSNHFNNSANSNSSSSTSNNFSSEVCRDFLRNVCRRGANCRYRHPEGSEAEELGRKVDLIFCHDYQNKECRRSSCRFIHCTKQEEEIYRASGKLPTHLIEKLSHSRLTSSSSPLPSSFHNHHHPLHQHQQNDFIKSVVCDSSTNNNGTTSNSASNLGTSFVSSFASSLSPSLTSSSVASPFSTPIPVCKDNLKGDCLRGIRCKFRHISQAEYDLELRSAAVHSAGRPPSMDRNHNPQHHLPPHTGSFVDGSTSYQGGLAPPEPKRRAYDASLGFGPQPPFTQPSPPHSQRVLSSHNHLGSIQPPTSNDFEFSKPTPPHSTQSLFNNSRFLEDENFTLRRHIEELKKQVADLMASNEFLIEQNAQLRTLGTRSTTTPLPSSLHSGQTISKPHSNESFIGSRPSDHQLNHYHHHHHQQQQQQHLLGAIATSLSAQTTGGGIPVSSMAALSTNVMSNSTNPLVSYPIMTTAIQSLRPPTVPHSLSH